MGAVAEFLDEFEIGDRGIGPTRQRGNSAWQNPMGLFGPGVYALTLNGEIIYVGKAKVLIQRLYAHWNIQCRARSGKPLPTGAKAIPFTEVKICPCYPSDLDQLERQMIARYRPKYNELLRPKGKVTLEEIGFNFTRFGIANVVETPIYRRRVT